MNPNWIIRDGSWLPLWERNYARDVEKLKPEAYAVGRRTLLKGAGAALFAEYLGLRRALARRGQATIVNAITNGRTGVGYQYLCQAIYTAATGDTILIPAGTAAPAYSDTLYCDWRQLYPAHFGFMSNSTYSMYMGGGKTAADYLTLAAVGTANNGRARISMPTAVLVAPFAPGDTEMFLDDVSPLTPPGQSESGDPFTVAFPWGDGSDLSRTITTYGNGVAPQILVFTGIDYANNKLTGMGGHDLIATLPIGFRIFEQPRNGQATLVSASYDPGIVMNNLEIWGAPTGAENGIRQNPGLPGDPHYGFLGCLTLNGCYIHDNAQGVGDGFGECFARFFNSEFFRCGYDSLSASHNIYIGNQTAEFIFDRSYSHKVYGAHLIKTRGYTNIFTYSRITGERTDANPGGLESCNIDESQGGLMYVIGCYFQQSLNAANNMINLNAEGFIFGSNPTQETYFINNTCFLPESGIAGGGSHGVQMAPIKINNGDPPVPSGLADNNLIVYCWPTPTGGVTMTVDQHPTGLITIGAHNILANTSNGGGPPLIFSPPLLAAVFADPTPGDFDPRLLAGSVPIGAGAVPGSSPEGKNLSAFFQLPLYGLPTPGTPIPDAIPRTDMGTPDVGAFEFGI